MRLLEHPLWLVGFRPFFSLACVSGMLLPALWVWFYTGHGAMPAWQLTPLQWHAHEMFFGFGWAVIGGFLLTASKNWVQIRGYHGAALMWLTVAWLIERLGMWYQGQLTVPLFWLSNLAFLVSIVLMLLWTLLRHRATDTFKDNYFFLIGLPLFIVAKLLLLSDAHFPAGVSMVTGIFRLAFLVMLERTLTQFMRNVFKVEVLRQPQLDQAIKLLAVMMIFESWLPRPLAAALALLLAVLAFYRFCCWYPALAFRRLEIGIMYLGYLAIVLQLVLLAGHELLGWSWLGGVVTHVFTLGVMGLIIPAMIVRIANGHTGRKVVFGAFDKAVLWLVMFAFVCRLLAPQLWPQQYLLWLALTAGAWFLAFGMLAWRYVPYLFQARVDGKEH